MLHPAPKLPFPPFEMRQLVGPTDEAAFDNPSRNIVLPEIPVENYAAVLDFGCGCGRLARQMIQQQPPPGRYLGIDLHKGMVDWARRNLTPHAPEFQFVHHNAYNRSFNPAGDRKALAFPAADQSFSLVIAWSVFTHLIEEMAVHYLREIRRALAPNGLFWSTWFLFDKHYFPMMQSFQNALYINLEDPANAVIFDRGWLLEQTRVLGLKLISAVPPELRGYQWRLIFSVNPDDDEVELGNDGADFGIARPPVPTAKDPSRIGG